MNEDEVKALMESATSREDWDAKCVQVRQACGGYPSFWFPLIVLSGLAHRVWVSFGEPESPSLQIYTT